MHLNWLLVKLSTYFPLYIMFSLFLYGIKLKWYPWCFYFADKIQYYVGMVHSVRHAVVLHIHIIM